MGRKRRGRRKAAEAGDYLLVTRRNPNAPEAEPGFYRPDRDEDIYGIVVHVRKGGAGADEVAEGYTTSSTAASVHAVAGADGTVELLPDDYTAWHMPGADDTSLGLDIVWDPSDPEAGEDALENAARWAAQRVDRHEIAVRHLSHEEWAQGRTGFIAAEELALGGPAGSFPWEHFLDLVDDARRRRRFPPTRWFRRREPQQVAGPAQAAGRGLGGLVSPRSAAMALGAVALVGAATVAVLQAVGGPGGAGCGAYLVAFSDGGTYWAPVDAVTRGRVEPTFHAVPFDDGNVYRVPSTAVQAVTLGGVTSYLIRSGQATYQLDASDVADAAIAEELDATLRAVADVSLGSGPAAAGEADPDLLALAEDVATGNPTDANGERSVAFLTLGSEMFAVPPSVLEETEDVPDSALPPSQIPVGSIPAWALPASAVAASDWPETPPPDLRGLGDLGPAECLEDGLVDGAIAAAPAGPATAGPVPAPESTPTTEAPSRAVPPTTSPLPAAVPAQVDLSGSWSIEIDITVAEGICAGEVDEDYGRTIKIEQDGTAISVVGLGDGNEEWPGSFDGSVLVFEGERGEDDGITAARFELSLDPSSGELSGAEFWTWAGGGASCKNGLSDVVATKSAPADGFEIVGTWRLRHQEYLDQLSAIFVAESGGEAGDLEFAGGDYTIELNADGTYVGHRTEWSFRLSTPDGIIVFEITSDDPGTWTADGGAITIAESGSEARVAIWIEQDGTLVPLPVGATFSVASEAISGVGTYVGVGDVLTVTIEAEAGPLTATFDRAG